MTSAQNQTTPDQSKPTEVKPNNPASNPSTNPANKPAEKSEDKSS